MYVCIYIYNNIYIDNDVCIYIMMCTYACLLVVTSNARTNADMGYVILFRRQEVLCDLLSIYKAVSYK